MSMRCQTGSALWASLYPGLGATGAQILAGAATGSAGAGVMNNDGLSPTAEYFLRVTTPPGGGATLSITELGQDDLTVPADGTYTWAYQLYENAVAVGAPQTVTVTVGSVTASITTASIASTSSLGASSVVAVFAASTVTAAGAITGSGSVGSPVISASSAALATVSSVGAIGPASVVSSGASVSTQSSVYAVLANSIEAGSLVADPSASRRALASVTGAGLSRPASVGVPRLSTGGVTQIRPGELDGQVFVTSKSDQAFVRN